MTGPARRTVVAHPETLAALRRRGRTVGRRPSPPPGHPADGGQDELTALLLRTLMRAQLSLAVRIAAVFVFLLGGLPLLLALSPELRHARLGGIDLPWLLLGVLIYPLMVAAGWWYVRLAERNEQDYTDLVERT